MALDLDAALAGAGTQAERAQLVALELIRRAIADLPQAIASNAGRSVVARENASSLADAMKRAALGTSWNPYQLPTQQQSPTFATRAAESAKAAINFAQDNQVTRSAAAQSGVKALNSASNLLANRFAMVIGPLNLLHSAVDSQASGMNVLGTATKVLAATIGPILLPAVTVASAALIGISDVIWARLLPNLDKFDRFVLSELIPAGEAMVGLFGKLADAMEWVAKKSGGKDGDESRGPLTAFSKLDKGLDKLLAGDLMGGAKDITSAAWRSAKGVVDPLGIADGAVKRIEVLLGGSGEQTVRSTGVRRNADGSITKIDANGNPIGGAGAFGSGMRDTLRELRMSLGSKASYTGLGDVGRNATLAAANQSPFEMKILERFDRAIAALERGATPEARAAFPILRDR
ncbi:MAG: hypothetical protein C0467_31320 [Planctomycetaceae bacterium]|nr:hypothetical protein [Planctomycetaceae bacterium]